MKNLPLEFSLRMKNLLGEEYESYEKAVNSEPVRGFRVNTDKISLEEFEKKLQPIWKKKGIDRNIVYKDAQKEGWKNKNQNMQLEIK